MTRSAIALCCAFALLCTACGAEEIGPGWVDPQQGTGGSQQGADDPTLGGGTDPGAAGETMRVTVDPLGSTTTCHETVAIQGTATPGSDVYALGGSSTSDIIAAHPETGRFCIDVPLRRNDINQIEVWAKHAELGPAEPAAITVTQDDGAAGCGGAAASTGTSSEPKLTNIAEGAPVTSKHGPKDGSNARVTDGDSKSWASWGGGDWWNPTSNYDGWVKVSLDNIVEVEKVIIRWRDRKGSGSNYATKYRFLYTAMSTDGFDEHSGQWVMPQNGDVKSGDGGEDTFLLKGEPLREVAVRMLQDGGTSYNETFAIAEIQIIIDENRGQAPAAQVQAGTCDTMANY